jgi:peptidoglycan/xylan/chitin deacetylase (PgdA/CDA1 family)
MVKPSGSRRLMGNAVPNGGNPSALLVTTSWDDGHPSDLRLADLLAKHEASGTFYIPNLNVEGRPVMQPTEIRCLGQHLEIGGHTRDHVSLTQLAPHEAAQQVIFNKHWLEDLWGREVVCFAYVRGQHNRATRRVVRNAGFRYARTVTNLSDAAGRDCYQMPTTLQFFPHSDDIYIRNYLSGGSGLRRLALLRTVLGKRTLLDRLYRAADLCLYRGGCFHIWGHSWELNEYDLWDEIDRLLAHLNALHAQFVTNRALWSQTLAFDAAAAPEVVS